jgi:RNA polymerase sigma factor (sigma-70 family)
MKDIRLNIKIKNNLILKKGEELYQAKSQSELAEKIGLNFATLGSFINFKASPVTKQHYEGAQEIDNGLYWRNSAIKVANALQCSPWEIFPEYLWGEKERNQYDLEIESSDVMLLFSDNETALLESPDNPAKELEQKETRENIFKALSTLTLKEEQILRLLFGIGEPEHGPVEIAKTMHLSRARIDQIKTKALRKLRHPKRRKLLSTFEIEDEDGV